MANGTIMKNGICYSGGGGSGSNLPDYSTTEQNTGQKWIDGKDIYVKTISVGAVAVGETNVAHGISNFDHLIKVFGKVEYASKDIPLPYVSSNANYNIGVGNMDGTYIQFAIGSGFSGGVTNAVITIEYTKATT